MTNSEVTLKAEGWLPESPLQGKPARRVRRGGV